MPWYGWLAFFLAFGMIISPLFSVLKNNKDPELTDEQKKRLRERNVKWDEVHKTKKPPEDKS